MRIVRPGSVVGPQQQYMYLKQLEWSKWAAVDELRKAQATTSLATATLVTPATPPAEADEEMGEAVQTTPTSVMAVGIPIPPVTPSKHVAAAQAKARAIAPPGQPRKTPQAKRVAADSEDEDETADILPALGLVPKPKTKAPARAAGSRATASEQRPTRVLRSTAGGATRKPPTTNGHGPHKIPRLATRNTAPTTARAATPSARRPLRAPPSPTPSRLPTLVPAKRTHNATTSLSEVASAATLKMAGAASDAWMTNNASAVVVPGSKSERPGLRSVRRRRSSFSSADVVA
jgi:cell division cycle 14